MKSTLSGRQIVQEN